MLFEGRSFYFKKYFIGENQAKKKSIEETIQMSSRKGPFANLEHIF